MTPVRPPLEATIVSPLAVPRREVLRWTALVGGVVAPVVSAFAVRASSELEPPILGDPNEIIRAHGYSFYGTLSYPPDFPHYRYVNPDAPKGGTISTWAPGTFDSFNPYTRRGRAARFSWSFYESLLETSGPFGDAAPADVYGEYYGLLAYALEYPRSKNWVVFFLRPEARFSDGTPLTAHDVVFTHNLFIEQGLPSYAEAVGYRVTGAEVIDDHTVRFTFREGISRRSLIDQVGSTPVFSREWFLRTGARLDESRLETSPGSGPYVLDSFEINRHVTYRRNPDYWGWHLSNNVGRHNFDVVRVDYYGDDAVAFEAFKGGAYSFRDEGNAQRWATGYTFPAVERGWVRLEAIPDRTPPTPTGFIFNLDRPQFADRRVREAISLAYNFEWSNQQLQYGLVAQIRSFSQGKYEAQGTPEGAERDLLLSLGDLVPREILEEPVVTPHSSNPDRLQDRRNLRRANQLLEEAGWIVGNDGVRRSAEGEPLRLVFPFPNSISQTTEAIILAFAQNLEALGLEVRTQKIDPAQYTLRSRERDYDMILGNYIAFLDVGTGLLQRFGCEARHDVFNPAGLCSPLVDRIINEALMAPTPEARDVALTALDRVLRWERFMIPIWYVPESWYAYWDVYRHPEDLPIYADGVLDFWWFDAERAAHLRAAGATFR